MKSLFYFTFFIAFFLPATTVKSQNVFPQAGCSDSFILHQADSIRREFISQGFIVVKEASMTMESESELPVIVPLTENIEYQFVFIGDISSKSYEVKMFDWDEKQVAYQKKEWGNATGNIICYAYTPKISEYHLIKPVQINMDKKNLSSYVMLLKKVK